MGTDSARDVVRAARLLWRDDGMQLVVRLDGAASVVSSEGEYLVSAGSLEQLTANLRRRCGVHMDARLGYVRGIERYLSGQYPVGCRRSECSDEHERAGYDAAAGGPRAAVYGPYSCALDYEGDGLPVPLHFTPCEVL